MADLREIIKDMRISAAKFGDSGAAHGVLTKYVDELERALAAQPAPAGEVDDAAVGRYLTAQRAFIDAEDARWGRPNAGGLHKDVVREACRAGLVAARAAAAVAEVPEGMGLLVDELEGAMIESLHGEGFDLWAKNRGKLRNRLPESVGAIIAKMRALLAAAPAPEAERAKGEAVAPFQTRVAPWMAECFGAAIASDVRERGDRLLEEVLELLQSHGYDPGRVATLRDYVFGRPVGEPAQEAGGVMVTLAAYCLATGIDMHDAGETELARIWTKVDVIRAKQASKRDIHSPLPGNPAPPPAGQPDGGEK